MLGEVTGGSLIARAFQLEQRGTRWPEVFALVQRSREATGDNERVWETAGRTREATRRDETVGVFYFHHAGYWWHHDPHLIKMFKLVLRERD